MNLAEIKANELIEKFRPLVYSEIAGENGFCFSRDEQTKNAKKCALISVTECIEYSTSEDCQEGGFDINKTTEFLEEVKTLLL